MSVFTSLLRRTRDGLWLRLPRDSAVAYLSTVTVAPITSTIRTPCAVNLHNAVTVSQQRLGRRVAQLSSSRMREFCIALRFSLGCDGID